MKIFLCIVFSLSFVSSFGQSTSNLIQDIREEFKKINSDTSLTIFKAEFSGKSTEGSNITAYLDSLGALKKVIHTSFFEMGQSIEEYYAMENHLCFVFCKAYEYNRPIYWSKEKARESGDEPFDIKKSVVKETRYYFSPDQKLIRYINDLQVISEGTQLPTEIEIPIINNYLELKEHLPSNK